MNGMRQCSSSSSSNNDNHKKRADKVFVFLLLFFSYSATLLVKHCMHARTGLNCCLGLIQCSLSCTDEEQVREIQRERKRNSSSVHLRTKMPRQCAVFSFAALYCAVYKSGLVNCSARSYVPFAPLVSSLSHSFCHFFSVI